MKLFEQGAEIREIQVVGKRWKIRVVDVYNPSEEEIASNEAFNDSLGNWEPDLERPTDPRISLEILAEDGERFEMYWIPTQKLLGPHIRRPGWSRGTFNSVKKDLLRWNLS